MPKDNQNPTRTSINIRAALPEDASDAAELIFMTGERIFKHLFYQDPAKSIDVIEKLFQLEGNEFTYQNAFIAEVNGKAGGLIHFLDLDEKDVQDRVMGKQIVSVIGLWPTLIRLPRFIQFGKMIPVIEADMLYIQHLATFDAFRGKGVATDLMTFCEQQAKQRKLSRLALDVVIDNNRAYRVYDYLGFKQTQTIQSPKIKRKYGFQGLYRMVKEISC